MGRCPRGKEGAEEWVGGGGEAIRRCVVLRTSICTSNTVRGTLWNRDSMDSVYNAMCVPPRLDFFNKPFNDPMGCNCDARLQTAV